MLNRIAVIIPANNEQTNLPGCLDSVSLAAAQVDLPVRVIVVLDDCTDGTATAARVAGAETVGVKARNVGIARAAGCELAMRNGESGLLLAHTDADTLVPAHWLRRQIAYLSAGVDVVAGTVRVEDWSPWPAWLPDAYDVRYENTHRHVHGANLAVTADAYRAAGGFPPRRTGEDRALVSGATRAGCRIHYATDIPVVCSSRRHARAPQGFSDYLHSLATNPS